MAKRTECRRANARPDLRSLESDDHLLVAGRASDGYSATSGASRTTLAKQLREMGTDGLVERWISKGNSARAWNIAFLARTLPRAHFSRHAWWAVAHPQAKTEISGCLTAGCTHVSR